MKSKKLEPKIRFKGFTEEWEEKKLGEMAEIRTGPFGSALHAGDYVDNGTPIITTEHFKSGNLPTSKIGIPQVSEADRQRLQYYTLNTDDIVFSRVGSVDINALTVPAQTGWLFSGRVLRVRLKSDICSLYVHHELSTARIRRNIVTRAVGQTMPSINTRILEETNIYLPIVLSEQRRIGTLFSSIDRLLTLHQRELTKLQNVKKAMLEKMFPKEGECVPEVRFKGFMGEWEEKKLGNIAEQTYGGGTPTTSVRRYWTGDIPWIQSSDLNEDEVYNVVAKKHLSKTALNGSAAKLVPSNSIAVVTRVGVGKLALMSYSYASSQDFISLSKLKTDALFTTYALYQKLQKDLHKVQGTSIKGITKEEVLCKNISLPFSISEQQRIGQFFSSLDRLLTLHQQELSKLQNIKKALLEKMFV